MPYADFKVLLTALLDARSNAAVQAILTEIGDPASHALDCPFGPLRLQWHAFGDNPSNLSTIGLGTKPGRSLTERITNAFDALLEEKAPSEGPMPASARAASLAWFGRPITGATGGLYRWDYEKQGHDRHVAVVLGAGEPASESAPAEHIVDVIDDGVGIPPQNFSDTILSLHSGNKIAKWYLIGAFGQGGAATLAFSDFALIISRHRDNPKRVGFTLVRVLDLNEDYKEDSYAYLAIETDGKLSVPSCDWHGDLKIYPRECGERMPVLQKGTFVRHFGYRLPNLDKEFQETPGNLHHYLNFSMFDPALPFRLIDIRQPRQVRDEVVLGGRNLLMNLVPKELPAGQPGTEILHFRQMEFVVPHGSTEACVGIEYWVVLNYRIRKDRLVLRPQSNELFVQPNYPIVGTLNGQSQGELSAQMLRELGLNLVARHIVIHIDATNADRHTRRELFSTNREGFREGPVLASLMDVLRRMLEEDQRLHEIERRLTEEVAHAETHAGSQEVKRQVSKLLTDAGFHVAPPAELSAPRAPRLSRSDKPVAPKALPVLPFPKVTRFQIVAPKERLDIHLADAELVLVESDADADFDRRNLVSIRTEPDVLEVASKTPLWGGRVRWRLRPKSNAIVGQRGRVIVKIARPDGTEITDELSFQVQAAAEPARPPRGFIPDFDVVAINPDDNPEEWGIAWPQLTEGVSEEEMVSVAYKPVRVGSKVIVYYSMLFTPFLETVVKMHDEESEGSLKLFKLQYEIWIGYHALLQEAAPLSIPGVAPDALDQVLEAERVRLAQLQVSQARATVDLVKRAMRERAVAR